MAAENHLFFPQQLCFFPQPFSTELNHRIKSQMAAALVTEIAKNLRYGRNITPHFLFFIERLTWNWINCNATLWNMPSFIQTSITCSFSETKPFFIMLATSRPKDSPMGTGTKAFCSPWQKCSCFSITLHSCKTSNTPPHLIHWKNCVGTAHWITC